MNNSKKVPIARHSVQTLGGMSPIISYRPLNRLGVTPQQNNSEPNHSLLSTPLLHPLQSTKEKFVLNLQHLDEDDETREKKVI